MKIQNKIWHYLLALKGDIEEPPIVGKTFIVVYPYLRIQKPFLLIFQQMFFFIFLFKVIYKLNDKHQDLINVITIIIIFIISYYFILFYILNYLHLLFLHQTLNI